MLQAASYLSWVDHNWKFRARKQRRDVGKYSFVNRTITDCNLEGRYGLALTKLIFPKRGLGKWKPGRGSEGGKMWREVMCRYEWQSKVKWRVGRISEEKWSEVKCREALRAVKGCIILGIILGNIFNFVIYVFLLCVYVFLLLCIIRFLYFVLIVLYTVSLCCFV
jgi:hypothetical protein